MFVFIQRIYLLPKFVIFYAEKIVIYSYMLTIYTQKYIEFEGNLNKLGSYLMFSVIFFYFLFFGL